MDLAQKAPEYKFFFFSRMNQFCIVPFSVENAANFFKGKKVLPDKLLTFAFQHTQFITKTER